MALTSAAPRPTSGSSTAMPSASGRQWIWWQVPFRLETDGTLTPPDPASTPHPQAGIQPPKLYVRSGKGDLRAAIAWIAFR